MTNIDLPNKFKYLLSMLRLAGRVEGKTRFQKLVFLLKKERLPDLPFNFVRYNYGPYSSELTNALEALEEFGLIDAHKVRFEAPKSDFPGKKVTYTLTTQGKAVAKSKTTSVNIGTIKKMKEILKKWNKKPLKELIKYVYSNYMN